MTTIEFSNEFDILVQEYLTARKFGTPVLGFNEYEKSVFLTQAQDEIVKSLYSGENEFNESFEETERLRRYLSNLVCTKSYKRSDSLQETEQRMPINPTSFSSYYFKAPDDMMYIIWEQGYSLGQGNCGVINMDVYPVTHDTLSKNLKNPFRQPKNTRCFRLDLTDNVIEIISKTELQESEAYRMRYIRRPSPIILENIEAEGLSIRGIGVITECELAEELHKNILDNAVSKALAARVMALQYDVENNRVNNAQRSA